MDESVSPTNLSRSPARVATLLLLAILSVWPALHYLAWRAWKIDVWHLAGWSMYGVPRVYDDIRITQLDGSPIPMTLRQQHQLDRISRRAGVLRYGYDPTPALQDLVETWNAGTIDGLHFRQEIYPFNGATGFFDGPEVVWDVEVRPRQPRVGAAAMYGTTADETLASLHGTTWAAPYGHAEDWAFDPSSVGDVTSRVPLRSGVVDRLLDRPMLDQTASLYGLTWEDLVAEGGCGSYPACARDERGQGVALYVEIPQLWLATCVGPSGVRALRGDTDSEHREEGRIIIWRTPDTLCWVPTRTEPALQRRSSQE